MTEIDRFKSYMELCGIYSNKQLVTEGEYPKTEQWLGRVLNGTVPFSDIERKRCYDAVNIARAKRLRKQAEELEGVANEQIQ
jgi:hypothetical protein